MEQSGYSRTMSWCPVERSWKWKGGCGADLGQIWGASRCAGMQHPKWKGRFGVLLDVKACNTQRPSSGFLTHQYYASFYLKSLKLKGQPIVVWTVGKGSDSCLVPCRSLRALGESKGCHGWTKDRCQMGILGRTMSSYGYTGKNHVIILLNSGEISTHCHFGSPIRCIQAPQFPVSEVSH